MGSANFSEQAFRGWQHETLAMYDDDDAAWDYYSARYREVRDKASNRSTRSCCWGEPSLSRSRKRLCCLVTVPASCW